MRNKPKKFRLSLLLAGLMTLMISCRGPVHYRTPAERPSPDGPTVGPIRADKLEVRSRIYPTFHATDAFSPPPAVDCVGRIVGCDSSVPTASIEPGDVWKVTHKVGERWIIRSEEFDRRQCRFLTEDAASNHGMAWKNVFGRCLFDREFGIYVTPEGRIDGGWQTLPSSRLLFGNRVIVFEPRPDTTDSWPVDAFRASERDSE